MINIQPISKRRSFDDGSILAVHSIFYTIQGEGPFTGHPAVFVRLAGCNLRCPSCDTEYTQNAKDMELHEIVDSILNAAPQMRNPLVVITGGEPFRQNVTTLAVNLISEGFHVQIETNGTLPLSMDFPKEGTTIVCSPKAGKIHPTILQRADAFKYVMSADSICEEDGFPILALNHSAAPMVARPPANFKGPIYIQPMDPGESEIAGCQYNENVQACVESAMKFGYILQIQIHKLVGVA